MARSYCMAWVTRLGLSLTVYHTTSPGHAKQPGSLRIANAHYTVQATVNGLGHSIQLGLEHSLCSLCCFFQNGMLKVKR